MLGVIQGRPVEMLTYTISLVRNGHNDLKMFHCIGCGTTIAQMAGEVKKIYPVLEPHADVPVLHKCRKCDKRYTFQTIQKYEEEPVKVVLHQETPRDYFFCYLGKGTPLLVLNNNAIYSVADKLQMKPPFHLQCSAPDCPIDYYFADLV